MTKMLVVRELEWCDNCLTVSNVKCDTPMARIHGRLHVHVFYNMTQHDFLSVGVHPTCSVSQINSLLGSPTATPSL